jgi:hypothetical protein
VSEGDVFKSGELLEAVEEADVVVAEIQSFDIAETSGKLVDFTDKFLDKLDFGLVEVVGELDKGLGELG